MPIGPPSATNQFSSKTSSHVFEWNRTFAKRVRNALIAENAQIDHANDCMKRDENGFSIEGCDSNNFRNHFRDGSIEEDKEESKSVKSLNSQNNNLSQLL